MSTSATFPEVQGHRGYGDEAPHNTIQAFRAAGQHPGVQSVEFDVRRSADGHLVVTHGPELGPNLSKATLEELREAKVPLLSEVLDCCLEGGLLMNVELKGGEPIENVKDTLKMLSEKGAFPVSRISSFDRGMLQLTRELEPSLPLGALYHPGIPKVEAGPSGQLVYYMEEPEDFASWFADHQVEGDSVNLRAEAFLRKPSLAEEARKHGKKVMVWFPCITNPGFEDGEEMYQKLIDLGVDVICCNKPSLLSSMMAKRD
mmetsp:Transcript_20261/g.44244  ORF Transcript_20261/g.44244 Transcript_20261/m.44244 type:complete len:259 (-) Transcript_20261:3-779(-)